MEDSPWFSTLGNQLSHDINMIKPWKTLLCHTVQDTKKQSKVPFYSAEWTGIRTQSLL